MNKRAETLKYIAADYLASAMAWTLFYVYRRAIIEPAKYGYSVPIFNFDKNYYLAIILVPVYWIVLYLLVGSYRNIFRKSRFRELAQTFTLTFIGTLVLFFFLLIDDVVESYQVYRYTALTLFLLQFILTYSFRLILLTRVKNKLKNRVFGFNTLLVGGNTKAARLYSELENEKYSQGYRFVGFTTIEGEPDQLLADSIPRLGTYHDIRSIIREKDIEEVIIAVESSEHHTINKMLPLLEDQKVSIKVIPDMYDIISGSVKLNYIFGAPLIEVMPEIMPVWQKNLKRLIDIAAAICILIIGFPFYLAISIAIWLTSRGPVFYRQERIGIHGRPFFIYKFRTMEVDAEKHGPRLSSDDDPRITPIGKYLRRYRLDEFPQFWNVLIGDMSIVGPRPERQFFIDQIVKIAPHYRHLLKVKPGITSWGQIKFGYASTVDEMVERMKFDILYIENMSIAMDIKIIFYTILIMLQGRGK